MTSVALPESLRVICRQAFYYCTKLTSIQIPKGVLLIEGNPFYYCTGLSSVGVDVDNQFYKAVDGMLFSKDGKLLICCPAAKSSATIPAGVVEIGDYAFNYCRQLRSISLPSGVKRIGNYAFYYCFAMESVVIPDGVESIGNNAFYNCRGLQALTIPDSVSLLGSSAFYSCSGLQEVNMPATVSSIGSNLFDGCNDLRSILVSKGTASQLRQSLSEAGVAVPAHCEICFGKFEFDHINYVVREDNTLSVCGAVGGLPCALVIPATVRGSNVTAIADKAFVGFSTITSIEIPRYVQHIGKNAFNGCKNVATVFWNSNWTSEVFVVANSYGWNRSVSDASVTFTQSFPYGASSRVKCVCDNTDTLSATVDLQWYYGWARCYRDGTLISSGANDILSRLTLSEHVIEFELGADTPQGGYGNMEGRVTVNETPVFKDWFNGSASISVVIGEDVSSIPGGLFAGCKNMKSIFLPKSVRAIGATSFYGCSGLSVIEVDSGNCVYKSVKGALFTKDGTELLRSNSVAGFQVPEEVVKIGSCAFAGNENLVSVFLPKGVTAIGDYAFDGCLSFKSVTMPSSVTKIGRLALESLRRVELLCKPPTGVSVSGLQSNTVILYPRKFAKEWRSYATANNYAIRRGPTAAILSANIRENDPTIMDVEYLVTSENPKVKVRAVAFKNGVRSFANVVRPETFVDGMAVNIGDEVEANVPHKLSWRVSADYGTELTKMKFEVLAQEGDLLPMEWIYIPKSEQYGKMKVSYNTLSEAQVFDALMWLYAAKDPGLTLSGGVLRGGGYTLASGATSNGSPAFNYVFSKMGWSVLSGAIRSYAISETRKTLPSISAYQIVE